MRSLECLIVHTCKHKCDTEWVSVHQLLWKIAPACCWYWSCEQSDPRIGYMLNSSMKLEISQSIYSGATGVSGVSWKGKYIGNNLRRQAPSGETTWRPSNSCKCQLFSVGKLKMHKKFIMVGRYTRNPLWIKDPPMPRPTPWSTNGKPTYRYPWRRHISKI